MRFQLSPAIGPRFRHNPTACRTDACAGESQHCGTTASAHNSTAQQCHLLDRVQPKEQ
jgi:hypothetical protein